MTDDRAAKKAEELAPCNRDCRNHFGDPTVHDEFCLANNRPAVAAELRKAYAEIERLKTMSTVEMMCENLNVKHHVEEWERRCLRAEDEIACLREQVRDAEKLLHDSCEIAKRRIYDVKAEERIKGIEIAKSLITNQWWPPLDAEIARLRAELREAYAEIDKITHDLDQSNKMRLEHLKSNESLRAELAKVKP